MEVKAKLRFLRMSPKKVRLVADVIRGLSVTKAGHQLEFSSKKSSRPLLKLLNSAIANAENNFKLERDNLFVKTITVDQGPTLMRWRPRAFGRATPIRKKSSHINIILGEIKPTKPAVKKATKKAEPAMVSTRQPVEKVQPAKTVSLEQKQPAEEIKEKPAEDHQPAPFDDRRQGKHRQLEHQDKKEMKKPGDKKGFLKKIFKRKAG